MRAPTIGSPHRHNLAKRAIRPEMRRASTATTRLDVPFHPRCGGPQPPQPGQTCRSTRDAAGPHRHNPARRAVPPEMRRARTATTRPDVPFHPRCGGASQAAWQATPDLTQRKGREPPR